MMEWHWCVVIAILGLGLVLLVVAAADIAHRNKGCLTVSGPLDMVKGMDDTSWKVSEGE